MKKPQLVLLLASVALLSPLAFKSSAAAPTPYAWRNAQIGGGGLCVRVEVSKSTTGFMYATSDVAGPWKRNSDSGAWDPCMWETATNPKNSGACEGIAIDPANSQIGYAALESGAGGLYKTTDGGVTWNVVLSGKTAVHANGGDARRYTPSVVVDPNNSGVVYWATRTGGLYRALTGGNTAADWTQRLAPPSPSDQDTGMRCLAIDPSTTVNGRSKVVYASFLGTSTSDGKSGIYSSSNGGDTFSQMAGFNSLPGNPTTVKSLAIAPDGTLYVAHNQGIARYAAGVWTNVTPSGGGGSYGIGVDPFNASRIVCTGSTALWRSLDKGATWTAITKANSLLKTGAKAGWFYLDPCAGGAGLTFDPHNQGVVYLCDSYMVWRTQNVWGSTVVCDAQYQGLENEIVMTLCAPPASASGNNAPLYSGDSDLRGFRHDSVDASPSNIPFRYDNFWGAYITCFDFCEANPDFMMTCHTDYSGYVRVYVSTDGGKNWGSRDTTPLNGTSDGDWGAPASVAISATNANNVVYCPGTGNRPRYSTDGGNSWNACTVKSTGATMPGMNGETSAYALDHQLASDRTNGSYMYLYQAWNVAKGQSPFWWSSDAGATWTPATTVLGDRGGYNAFVAPVTVATPPGRAGEVWVALNSNGLWKSTDFGNTFTKATYFQNTQPLRITFGKEAPGNPASSPTIYVYGKAVGDTDFGVYRSIDNGATWSLLEGYSDVWAGPMAADRRKFGVLYMGQRTRALVVGQPAALQFETESVAATPSAGVTHRVITAGGFSGGAGTILDATAVGQSVTYTLPGIAAGSYDVRVGVKGLNTRGIFQLAASRADVASFSNIGSPQDEYSSGETYSEFDLGAWTPATTSDKSFRFTVTGKNASSSGYSIAFDYILLTPQ